MTNKYLFVLGTYFPNPSANGICVNAIIKELKRQGDDVYVLCEDVQQLRKYRIDSNNEKIYFIKTRKINRLSNNLPFFSKIIRNTLIISHYLSWPITSLGVAKRYEYMIGQICKENNIQDIVCVVNPTETIIAANKITTRTDGLKFYYYFLDAFFEGKKPKWLTEKSYKRKIMNFAEETFPAAFKIVFMKNHTIPENIRTLFGNKISILDIPLVTRNETIKYVNKSKEFMNKLHFVYVGSFIDGLRSPENMLYFFDKLHEKNIEFMLDIYGNLTNEDIEKKYHKLIQSGKLKINGKISHEEALKCISNADIVVNVGSENTSFIPSKIFEYFSMKKPILNFSTKHNDPSDAYFEKYGHSYTVVQKEVPINFVDSLDKLVENAIELNKLDIEKIFAENTPKEFIEEVLRS